MVVARGYRERGMENYSMGIDFQFLQEFWNWLPNNVKRACNKFWLSEAISSPGPRPEFNARCVFGSSLALNHYEFWLPYPGFEVKLLLGVVVRGVARASMSNLRLGGARRLWIWHAWAKVRLWFELMFGFCFVIRLPIAFASGEAEAY